MGDQTDDPSQDPPHELALHKPTQLAREAQAEYEYFDPFLPAFPALELTVAVRRVEMTQPKKQIWFPLPDLCDSAGLALDLGAQVDKIAGEKAQPEYRDKRAYVPFHTASGWRWNISLSWEGVLVWLFQLSSRVNPEHRENLDLFKRQALVELQKIALRPAPMVAGKNPTSAPPQRQLPPPNRMRGLALLQDQLHQDEDELTALYQQVTLLGESHSVLHQQVQALVTRLREVGASDEVQVFRCPKCGTSLIVDALH